MEWLQLQFDSLLSFFTNLKDMLISYFSDIHHLVIAITRGATLLDSATTLLPPYLQVFAGLTVTTLILLQIIGRNNSGG